MKSIYYSKWFPRLFYKKPDGGKDSGVTGYFLIEWKILFSIGILHFKKGSREAYHSHAFNALTFWIKGKVAEQRLTIEDSCSILRSKPFQASFRPKFTKKDNLHRVVAITDTYALTFRGPWEDTWKEFKKGKFITLTHGRVQV